MKKIKIKGLLLVILLSTFSFGYSQKANVQKISDNVFSMFIYHYHSLVVIGDNGVLLVDPANSSRAQILKNEIKKLTDLPVSHIVLSHEHYDHIGGTEVFKGAQIYAQRNASSILSLDITGTSPKVVHNWFENRATIMMGKTKVNLHHYAAGDGVATTIVHLPKEGVVYAADMFDADAGLTDQAYIEDHNTLGVRLILNNMVDLKPKYAISSHTEGLNPEGLIKTAAFYNDLYDAVAPAMLAAMSKGFLETMKTIRILPQDVKLEKYKNLRNYNSLSGHVHRMAMAIFHGG